MARVDPQWGLHEFLGWYEPHASWLKWFPDCYAQAMESPDPEIRLRGWKDAAWILGDMGALVLCMYVCHYGRTLVPDEDRLFLAHIDVCLADLGLARRTRTDAPGWKATDPGTPGGFIRDHDAAEAWMAEQLEPFGGDLERAARFGMRLTAVRLGLLDGPRDPTIGDIENPRLWVPADPR